MSTGCKEHATVFPFPMDGKVGVDEMAGIYDSHELKGQGGWKVAGSNRECEKNEDGDIPVGIH
jgi:hypothetical protein